MDVFPYFTYFVIVLISQVSGIGKEFAFNPWQDRECMECTYTNQAPDGQRVKIVFEDMIDIVDNQYKCNDPWYGGDDVRRCPAGRCMKVYQRWHNQVLMLRRCETASNACVERNDWSPEYHVHVQCCDNRDDWPHRSTECNAAYRPETGLFALILVAIFAAIGLLN